jgi:hypothetical protein
LPLQHYIRRWYANFNFTLHHGHTLEAATILLDWFEQATTSTELATIL